MPITSRQTPIRTFSFINDGKNAWKKKFFFEGWNGGKKSNFLQMLRETDKNFSSFEVNFLP